MIKGWIVTNTPKSMREFMRDEFSSCALNMGLDIAFKSSRDFLCLSPDNLPAECPDFIIAYNKNHYQSKVFEDAGIRVFNSSEANKTADSKIASTIRLWEAGIAQPETIIGLMNRGSAYDLFLGDFINEVGERLGYPLIVKKEYGSMGNDVFLVHDEQEFLSCPAIVEKENRFIVQKFISETRATDIRIVVVGDEVVYSMRRRGADGDFRSNVGCGGTPELYHATAEECALAIETTHAFGLDWAGIDILQSDEGPMICEVNSNPHFARFEKEEVGVRIPEFYYRHIVDQIQS